MVSAGAWTWSNRRVHVGIDGLHLFGPYSGVHYALSRTVLAMRANFPEDRVTLWAPKDFKGAALDRPDNGLAVRRTWFPGRWRTVRTLWRNFRLQSHAYAQKCDLLHGGTYALPSVMTLPSVVTVHDLIPLTHPQFCTPGSAKIQKRQLPRSVTVARRVQVPTEAVKAQVVELLKADPERVDVVPWGVGPEFARVEDDARLEHAREQWKLPERFVLYVGTLEAKKDVAGLIKAFFAAKMNSKIPHTLVLAGRMGWGVRDLEKLVRDLNAQEYVLFTGYVPEEALPLLYNLAEVTVLASHVEGFGMPVLEAMACGCPVIVSGDAALKEVSGGAALVAETGDGKPFQRLRECIESLTVGQKAEQERARLREVGRARADEFTWKRTAELTRASYQKALD